MYIQRTNNLTGLNNIINFKDLQNHIGTELIVQGRVLSFRNQGQIAFIDLYSLDQILQIVILKPDDIKEKNILRRDTVIQCSGILEIRQKSNDKIVNGQVELILKDLTILSISQEYPFDTNASNTSEELQNQYRFLKLRGQELQHNLVVRNNIKKGIYKKLINADFIEIETPTLVKSTPEGARDFLVPSRLHKGEFYALPQSPQLYKQILMQSGFEKYFQFARCYRDEDLRGDRQLEFTQIDIEVAYYGTVYLKQLIRSCILDVFHSNNHTFMSTDFEEMSYQEAWQKYGSDKPDIRFDSILKDLKNIVYFILPQKFTSKERSELATYINTRKTASSLDLQIKIFADSNSDKLETELKNTFKEDETLFYFQGDDAYQVRKFAGEIRAYLGKKYIINNKKQHAALWIVDFPMFEKNQEGQYTSVHHPFTRPKNIKEFLNNPYTSLADAYDLVIDGVEVGGGSVRIHEPELQQTVFELLGTDASQFEGLISAYKFGAVPHCGLALGFDRLVTFFGESSKIADYIAFPKNMQGIEYMLNSPSKVSVTQLNELGLRRKKEAATCVLIQNGKILASSRRGSITDYGLIGGKLDQGETFEEAAKRELLEETGLIANDLQKIHERHDGDSYVEVFLVTQWQGEPRQIEDGILVDWLDYEILEEGSFGHFNKVLRKKNPIIDQLLISTKNN